MGNRIRNNALIADRRAERKKQKARKRNIIIIIAAICLIAVIAIWVIASMPHYSTIEADGDRYIDRSTGIYYLAAPLNYEPVSYTRSPYGKLSGNYVYPITGKSTSEWLAEDYYGILYVYYAEELTLPTLDEFYPDRIQVCSDNSSAVVRLADIKDEDDVDSVIRCILNAPEASEPTSSEAVYTLRVSSSRYSWIYYNITYIVSESGRYYYDRGTGRCVEADGIVAEYLEGATTELPSENAPNTADTENGTKN